ncbi:MAG: phosphatidate cytidylyltransferase [Nitrospiraceae bacterium]
MTRHSVEYGLDRRPSETVVTSEPSSSARRTDSHRLYAAIVFIPLFYVLVRYLPPAAFFALVLAVALFALTEFYRMHFRERRATVEISLGLGLAGFLLISLQWPNLVSQQTVWLVTVGAVLASRLFLVREIGRSLVDSAVVVFGILYIGFSLGHLLLIRALPDAAFLIFFVVLITWAGDTGAYYAGVHLGHRKLAPTISPNKTIEGLMGGVILAIVAAFAARFWFLPSFTTADCLATGVLLAAAGVLGDLSESALKRSAGVKDSGTMIPAHGGMLDRVDSLLFTAPAFYYYMTLVKG